MSKIVDAFDEAAKKFREKEKKKLENTDPTPKQILDKWATAVVPKEAIYITDNNAGVNQNKCQHYGEHEYNKDLVLWIAPKDCIRIEFEDTPEHNHRFILELESVAKSMGFDYCITGHGGKSDYFNMFNIKGLPLNDDNKAAKMLLIDTMITSKAKDQLDRTNLGWTLSPIIEHQHWKPKYDGNIHKILRGKSPIEHDNKYPSKLLKKLEKAKQNFERTKGRWDGKQEWIRNFLLDYCCNNSLPKGARHSIIEKNLCALIMFDKDKEAIKKAYYKAQGRTHDSLRTWERAILNGEYTRVFPGEIAKFIKEYSINFEIPPPEQISDEEIEGDICETLLNLYVNNKEDIAENFYKMNPYFYDVSGFFWVWNKENKSYERKDELELMNGLKKLAENKHFQVTQQSFWGEMIRSLKLVGNSYKPKPFKKTWIQFKETIYDYKTKETFEASPEFFNVNPIPYKIGEKKETPVIDRLFEEWVGKEFVPTLKEVIGLGMIQDYPLHRIICLHGRGLNGKGVFLKFMRKLFGKNNVCSASLTKLIKSNFEASKLYKKLICQMPETDFATLKDTSIIKQLTGQDLVSAEFKGKDSFDFENFATIFIATNSLPITEDRTDGFYRRWMIIDFPNQFEEGKDIIKEIPEEEYSNLCLQLLDTINEVIERGIFTNDGTIEERRQRYEDKSNPLKLFIRENFEENINGSIPFFEFYDKFNIFCSEHGFRELSKKNVSQVLDDMGYHTEKRDIKIEDEWKKWVFINGIEEFRTHRTVSTPNHIHFIRKRNEYETGFERYERDEIDHKCHICGETPSIAFDNSSQGKPICTKCLEYKQKQSDMEETVK